MSIEHNISHNADMATVQKIYSETVIDHAMNPRNAGSILNADGFGHITRSCGDTMEIWLKVRDARITSASFWTNGCTPTIACGSMATQMLNGKNIPEAQRISQQDILQALGGLPKENEHCALLVANTIKEAVKDYLHMNREPWKKAYRNR